MFSDHVSRHVSKTSSQAVLEMRYSVKPVPVFIVNFVDLRVLCYNRIIFSNR